jgi:hypothetical protein
MQKWAFKKVGSQFVPRISGQFILTLNCLLIPAAVLKAYGPLALPLLLVSQCHLCCSRPQQACTPTSGPLHVLVLLTRMIFLRHSLSFLLSAPASSRLSPTIPLWKAVTC